MQYDDNNKVLWCLHKHYIWLTVDINVKVNKITILSSTVCSKFKYQENRGIEGILNLCSRKEMAVTLLWSESLFDSRPGLKFTRIVSLYIKLKSLQKEKKKILCY